MEFAYTIWNEKQYNEIDSVVAETRDIVDHYIITTMPELERDNVPVFTENGIDGSVLGSWMNKALLCKAIEACLDASKKLSLQIIPTPKESRGKEPQWWQGWVWYEDETKWNKFFNLFEKNINYHLSSLPYSYDYYFLGAELISTLGRTVNWESLIQYIDFKVYGDCSYSHHFAHPLKHHYNWQLSLLVLFGYLFRGPQIYSDILSRLLTDPFLVPEEQRIQVGKNLYHAPITNKYATPVKLNDYFWYVMDKKYTALELMNRWEYVKEGGTSIEFMPAIRSWIKKYGKDKEVWIENDLAIGYTDCDDDYYSLWWSVFMEKHQSLADVIVCWDNAGNYKRWAKAIRSYLEIY